MTVTLWDPLRELEALERAVDSLFARDGSGWSRAAFPVDVAETRDAFVLRADLPGVRREDVKVELDQDTLVVRAVRRRPVPDDARYVVQESPAGEMVRAFRLEVPVDPEGVTAELADGVLEIRLRKAEAARPREIPVRTPVAALSAGASAEERPAA